MILPDQLRGRPDGRVLPRARRPRTVPGCPSWARSRPCSPRSRTITADRPRSRNVVFQFIPEAERAAASAADGQRGHRDEPPSAAGRLPASREGRPAGQAQLHPLHGRASSTIAKAPWLARRSAERCSTARTWRGWCGTSPAATVVAIPTVTLPEDFGFHPGLKPYAFDPVRARSLLAEAGTPTGSACRASRRTIRQTLATALAQQWAKIGVKLELAVEGRAPTMTRWIKERDRHDFLILDPTSIIFDAAFQLRLHLDPAHPMSRVSPSSGRSAPESRRHRAGSATRGRRSSVRSRRSPTSRA